MAALARQPTICFGITYHNEVELLRELVNQVCMEDEGPDEILIYDDCSTNPPADLLSDPRLKIFRGSQNAGRPTVGRNFLLRVCASDYIHFHDADDLIVPGWSKKTRDVLERTENRPDVIYYEIEHWMPSGLLAEWRDRIVNVTDSDTLISHSIENGLLVPSTTVRVELARRIGGYPQHVQSEDYAFNINLALARPKFVVLAGPSIIVRLRNDSRSKAKALVYGDGLRALCQVADRIPPSQLPVAAMKALSFARLLYSLGDEKAAAAGFEAARRWSWRCYGQQRWGYAIACVLVGGLNAERLRKYFREVLFGSRF